MSGPAPVALLPLETLETPAPPSLLVTLAAHAARTVTLALLAAAVRVQVPAAHGAPLAGRALRQPRAHAAARVRVTHVSLHAGVNNVMLLHPLPPTGSVQGAHFLQPL